jgi:uncharacterized protein (TIGR03435 family)
MSHARGLTRLAAVPFAAAIVTMTNPALAQGPSPSPERLRFDVASVRPVNDLPGPSDTGIRIRPGGRLVANAERLRFLIQFAYDVQPPQRIIGSQSLLDQYFAVNAVAPTDLPVPPRVGFMGTFWAPSPFNAMMRTLLEERFALRVSWKEEPGTVQVLTLLRPGEPGPGLKPLPLGCNRAAANPLPPAGPVRPRCGVSLINGKLTGATERLTDLADALTLASLVNNPERISPFVDETGLTGSYEVTTQFDIGLFWASRIKPGEAYESQNYQTFAEALRRDLGLRLDLRQRPMPMLVVEHIEPPTPD